MFSVYFPLAHTWTLMLERSIYAVRFRRCQP